VQAIQISNKGRKFEAKSSKQAFLAVTVGHFVYNIQFTLYLAYCSDEIE